jgi:hypothetical protein
MYGLYWVLITEDEFGVFEIEATSYPMEFIKNIKNVEVVPKSNLKKFLLENVGRNTLINSNFHHIFSIGRLYSRKPY